MNQKKFKLGTSIARARVLKARYVYSLKQNSGTVQTLYRRRLLRALLDIKILCRRSISISMYTFNLNSYSNEECLRDFRFLPTELPRIMSLVGFGGVTSRNGYVVNPMTATCILL